MTDGAHSFRYFIVVAAVIRDSEGRILLTRRPEGRHMAGLWEFPGGKVADGESPASALVRELDEELGLQTETGPPITFAVHEEPELRILLLFFESTILGGTPTPREGQEIVWARPELLGAYPTPPADADLVAQLIRGRPA
jgi:8-oxo-dGTP diphosphatase